MIPVIVEPTAELAALAAALDGQAPPCAAAPDDWFDQRVDAALVCRARCPAITACAALAAAIRPGHGVWAGVDREQANARAERAERMGGAS